MTPARAAQARNTSIAAGNNWSPLPQRGGNLHRHTGEVDKLGLVEDFAEDEVWE
jgi:hypothetical protein